VTLLFKNIKYSIETKNKDRKIILDNVSGIFYKGEISAILGPSGCGKVSDKIHNLKNNHYISCIKSIFSLYFILIKRLLY
jgi:ABC-type dipeptide/oligopeptide/nickel transport system ATPase subunit